MKKNNLLLLFLIMFLIISGVLLCTKYKIYSIITLTISLISILMIFDNKKENDSTKSNYEIEYKKIIKTYYSMLVCINDMPDFKDKTIVKVKTFDDLVIVQEQLQKPIYYIENTNSISFMVIEKETVSLYSLKKK